MDVVDDAEGPLDPRIQIELENLNNATDDINKLEIELDEAHTAFRQLLSESTKRLKEIMDKLGAGCMEKVRCYYEALNVARQAQIECQQQAQSYQRASEIHAAAKETVALAEARFMSHQHEWNFDQAWQDMLNHATIKVMDAENQKAECAREHHRKAVQFHDAEKKVQHLEEKYRRSIIKARPYFETRVQCEQMLATQKERVEYLQKAVKEAKKNYALSLRALEEISNQIHEQRRDYDIVVNGPREPGVGAELVSPATSLNYEVALDKLHVKRINSLASSEHDTEDGTQDSENDYDTKQNVEHLGGRSVDGSESTSNQWELELQASLEKLNTLPVGVSITEEEQGINDNTFKAESYNKKDVLFNTVNHDILNKDSCTQSNDTSLCNTSTSATHTISLAHGWHSLTHSPINSILSKSKTVLKNNISKSLSASPVNMANFSFRKWKIMDNVPNKTSSDITIGEKSIQSTNSGFCNTQHNEITPPCVDGVQKVVAPSQHDVNVPKPVKEKQTSSLLEHTQNTGSTVVSEAPTDKKFKNEDKHFTSYSADVSPAKFKSKELRTVKSLDNRLNNDLQESFEQGVGNALKAKELPLLSIFRSSANLDTNRIKSCSMINLDDKQSLKALLGTTDLNNIQAKSVEKLAFARHNLIGEKPKIKV